MKGLTEYIESELKEFEYDSILLKFERNMVEEGNETEARVRKAGLGDENVMLDLFKSAYPNLKNEYADFRKKELKRNFEKKTHKFMLIGTPIYFLVIMAAVYLAVSFITHNWGQSWLIIIGFVTVWLDTVGGILIKEIIGKRRLFHPIARVLLWGSVMMTATLVFLVGLIMFKITDFWVVFPAGVAVGFLADALFAKATKQPLRIINYLIYIIAAMTMIFVTVCGMHLVPWNRGWLLIILSLVIDVAIIILKVIDNRKYIYRPEEDD